jgi:copper oxidase (laccase) domain-containing protein
MPEPLRGKVEAILLCRGELLDGTGGAPSLIAGRMGHLLGGRSLVAPWQVHGTAVVQGRAMWALPQRVKADGVHLDRAFDRNCEVLASLRFADCAPILIASAIPRPWAVILHSGFRGTLRDIFGESWRGLVNFYRGRGLGLDPAETYAWIGPAIGPCCFTRALTEEAALRAEEEWGPDHSRREGGLVHLDLIGVIAERMRASGIPSRNIMTLPLCTSCNRDMFYSYRSGDSEDRMTLVAGLKSMPLWEAAR